jgi:hypothetical protein
VIAQHSPSNAVAVMGLSSDSAQFVSPCSLVRYPACPYTVGLLR